MAIAYQYDAAGYYVGQIEDHGFPANNVTRIEPVIREDFIPHFDGMAWHQIEDHTGKEGFLNGLPHTITDYGPLPDGWSEEKPLPEGGELDAEARAYVLAELATLDARYLTPRVLAGIALGDAYALECHRIHEQEAEIWRERLSAIPHPEA